MCGKKSRRDQVDMWWGNEEVKNTIATKKAAFKELSWFPSEENKIQTFKKIKQQKLLLVL